MRKTICTLSALLLMSIVSTAQVRVGPFLGYGQELNLWGLGAHSEILLNDRVSISAVFTQYFPEDLDDVPRRTVWELNANLNYYVIRGDVGYLYGLAGVNYTHFKVRTRTAFVDVTEKDGNLGFNAGVGTLVRINEVVLPFVEGKYTAGGYSQFTLTFGVRFQLGDSTLEDDF